MMTSQDKEFIMFYFDQVNSRLDRLEQRTGKLEQRAERLEDRQDLILSRLDYQDKLLMVGLGWFTLVFTGAMFLQLFRREKLEHAKSNSESKSFLSWDSVKELIAIMKSKE